MLMKEHMCPKNKAELNGVDIECINSDLENIEHAKNVCDAVKSTLIFMNNPWDEITEKMEESCARTALKEFTEDSYLKNGLISALEIVSQALTEIENNITVIFEKRTEFVEEFKEYYQYHHQPKEK
jgi:hypothetical protein